MLEVIEQMAEEGTIQNGIEDLEVDLVVIKISKTLHTADGMDIEVAQTVTTEDKEKNAIFVNVGSTLR